MSNNTLVPNVACVYCGSSPGKSPEFMQVATAVGEALALSGITLVYGGGKRGMMGATAFACAKAGGTVLGVIPRAIKESGGEGTGPVLVSHDPEEEKAWARVEDIVVDSMHERKKVMATRSGAFIGLPGGYGTLEEVFEVITWNQLGVHTKPVLVLNVLGYYDLLRQMINKGVEAGFIKPENASLVKIVDPPSDGDWGKAVVDALRSWTTDAGAGYGWRWVESNGNTPLTDVI
ncbi:hypothetical protein BDV93DRAFT_517383 [Ceratobasidium sp. AG-I]|nr:hypothetical protein BDV93DRAFT_517383 [Ceratobasidium sp. AG-I]